MRRGYSRGYVKATSTPTSSSSSRWCCFGICLLWGGFTTSPSSRDWLFGFHISSSAGHGNSSLPLSPPSPHSRRSFIKILIQTGTGPCPPSPPPLPSWDHIVLAILDCSIGSWTRSMMSFVWSSWNFWRGHIDLIVIRLLEEAAAEPLTSLRAWFCRCSFGSRL